MTSCSKTITDTPPQKCLDALLALYLETTGSSATDIVGITGSASQRHYYHISGSIPLVGTIGNEIIENEAFFHIGKVLADNNVNVPRLVAVSDDRSVYLQEDLGNITLYDLISGNGFTPDVIELCRRAIDQLVRLQLAGVRHIDTSFCHPVPAMSGESIMWDLNYFKYCFLKNQISDIDEPRLEHEFRHLTRFVEESTPRLFIHRDFQSRNIIIHSDDAWIIDFQGGRLGPALYDIVSFLWQARTNFPDNVRNQLLRYYIKCLSSHIRFPSDNLDSQLDHIIIFRMLQVLGAYGFRGLVQRKQHFITFIPQALKCLLERLENCGNELPYLSHVIGTLSHSAKHITSISASSKPALTVTVYSFSYKKGIPSDDSGNGGGFVFDCRAIHNPGRYDRYRQLTGDDIPVIEFLEHDGEITHFLNHCIALVDTSVRCYISRGFTSLSIAFGCTGGQHRSVYAATHMAAHISHRYGIHVRLIHREQDIIKEFNP